MAAGCGGGFSPLPHPPLGRLCHSCMVSVFSLWLSCTCCVN